MSSLVVKTICAALLVAVASLTLTLVPLRSSTDEWWHLKTGQYIDEHGLPENEVFTYTAEKIRWDNHEWLSQIMFWKIYKWGATQGIGGVRALIFFKAAFITLTFVALAVFGARMTSLPLLSSFVAAMAIGMSRRTFYPRPPFLTYGLMALVLIFFIVHRRRNLPNLWLVALVPLFALWANLHGGFMAGLIIVGAFWLESLIDWALARWRMESEKPTKDRALFLTALMALCFIATLATPYGIELYRLASRVLQDDRLKGIIFELQPPDWRFVWIVDGWAILLTLCAVRPTRSRQFLRAFILCSFYFILARLLPQLIQSERLDHFLQVTLREAYLVIMIVFAGARSKSTVGFAQTIIALFFLHQGIQHVRHLPLAAVAICPLTILACADWFARLDEAQAWKIGGSTDRSRSLSLERMLWIPLSLFALYYMFVPNEAYALLTGGKPWLSNIQLNKNLLRGESVQPGDYPVEAAEYLLQHDLPGRIWNGGNYAGYLIWRLSPERYKVFTDNRYDIYGGEFITDEMIVREAFEGDPARNLPDWQSVLKKWEVRTMIVDTSDKIQKALPHSLCWQQAWNDGHYAIWTCPEAEQNKETPPQPEATK